jgi:hypothetical protein
MNVFARNNQVHLAGRRRGDLRLGGWFFIALIWLGSGTLLHAQTLQDMFTNRVTFTSFSGDRTASNTNATVEPNEPKHGGKTGGHSLWISWTAPADGIVTFDTVGSTFDTLLSAYYFQNTNDTSLSQLKELAENDDAPINPSPGALKTSLISFGAQVGKKYEIAVDGYKGATGSARLRWSFEVAPSTPPIVLTTPNSAALQLGDPVTLSVDITPEPNINLQWRFNGESFGQIGNTLSLPSLQTNHLGTYTLRIEIEVGNDRVRFETTPFELQVNSEGQTNALARDKLLDSPDTPLLGSDGGGTSLIGGGLVMRQLVAGGGGVQNIGVVRGYNGSQIFNTFYATADSSEPAHCNVIGGSSYWLIYQPPTNGTLTLNTLGSTYDTVLETYTYNGTLAGYQDLISLACDNNGYGTNGPSRVQIPVVKSRQYIVSVDGVNAAFGTAWLNYSLNTNANAQPQPPTLTGSPQPLTVAAGSTIVLTAPVTGSVPLAFAWRKDNVLMPGQSAPAIVLVNVTNTHSGNYSFVVTNDLGSASGTFALKVVVPPVCSLKRIPTGMQLSYPTLEGQIYTIEESTNLLTGWVAWPGSFVGNGLTNFFNVWNSGTKFYRVRVE